MGKWIAVSYEALRLRFELGGGTRISMHKNNWIGLTHKIPEMDGYPYLIRRPGGNIDNLLETSTAAGCEFNRDDAVYVRGHV